MNELSFFTGGGGGILGTMLMGWKLVGCVEWDDYCQRILKQRMEDQLIERVPIFGDIRAFISEGYAASYKGMVDVITAGFPCQPFSVAGKQAGEDDPRNMWPPTIEAIRIIRPAEAVLENVPGLLNVRQILTLKFIQKVRQLDLFGAGSKDTIAGQFVSGIETIAVRGYFGRILRDLAESGYDAKWRVLSAAEVGAPHKRDRLWIVCRDTPRNNEREIRSLREGTLANSGGIREDVADAIGEQDNGKRPACKFRRDSMGRKTKTAQCENTKTNSDSINRCCEDVADTEGDTQRSGLCESEQGQVRGGRPSDGRGAPGKEDVAYADGKREPSGRGKVQETYGEISERHDHAELNDTGNGRTEQGIPDATGERSQESARDGFGELPQENGACPGGIPERRITEAGTYWRAEPDVGRMADGVAHRVDRLKAIGNGQVPAVVRAAYEFLTEAD